MSAKLVLAFLAAFYFVLFVFSEMAEPGSSMAVRRGVTACVFLAAVLVCQHIDETGK